MSNEETVARSAWYWDRLHAMSATELRSRLIFAARKLVWRRRSAWVTQTARVVPSDRWSLATCLDPARDEIVQLLAEADRFLDGHCDLLNVRFPLSTPDWHLDPQTGTRAPLSFAFDIDYRNTAVAGNVKNIWELNRHRHLTVLAAAYAVCRDERYASEVRRQLVSWIECNPVAHGVNWHSALEIGVRLIAWVWIERLLRGSQHHEELFGVRGRMWSAVYWHQWMIARHTSCGSSANNHLVGEMAGLFIASTVWPYFDATPRWQAMARSVLEQEIQRQTFASGLNREQAFSYHCFTLALFLLPALEARRAGAPLSAEYTHTIGRMLAVIPGLTDAAGNLPRYGDDDGAIALQLQPAGASPVDWLFRLSNAWADSSFAVSRAGSGMLAAILAWPDGAAAADVSHPPAEMGSQAFEDAGVFVLATNRGGAREVFCLADAGPLGFLSIAAHGHADALSFVLSVGGVPVIIDPGTHSYFGDPQARAYFRGTKAHNTIVVDERDQSQAAGPFLWKRHAHCRILRWTTGLEGTELTAEHDGYAHHDAAVVHRRRLQLSSEELLITDELTGQGTHRVEWRLHFSPQCRVELNREQCEVRWDRGALDIGLSTNLRWRIASGETDAGWYSTAHNLKQPTVTLIGSCEAVLPQIFRSQIRVRQAA